VKNSFKRLGLLTAVSGISIFLLLCCNAGKVELKILRSQYDTLKINDARQLVIEGDYFDKYWNKSGAFKNHYKRIHDHGVITIRDKASNLMWHRSGSTKLLTLAEARSWISALNTNNYAGYSNWRLPSLEEALSLLENKRMNGSQYIDPYFDTWQWCIHTGDLLDEHRHWLVAFSGRVDWCESNIRINYVRPVRTMQAVQ
jgi:hypothetical protein